MNHFIFKSKLKGFARLELVAKIARLSFYALRRLLDLPGGHYSKSGKITRELGLTEFIDLTAFVKDPAHKAFVILLYYTGVRVSELLRSVRTQYEFRDGVLLFEVGRRLKGGMTTAPLRIPLSLSLMAEVEAYIKPRRPNVLVFNFNRVTAWRILRDYYGAYPHYFRLNRITQFLRRNYSLIEVKNWTGHKSLGSIDAYAGIVNVEKMGESLNE